MTAFDIVWPLLGYGHDDVRREVDAQITDVLKVQGVTTWGDDALALAEAHRLADREQQRGASTDSKASNYLLVIAALIPLLTSLESTVWDQKFGTAPKWLSLSILAVAVSYVLGAGWWAFKVLTVGKSHTLSGVELSGFLGGQADVGALVKEILTNARRNTDLVNLKVSSIIMAHVFLKRAVLAFGILLLAQVAWYWFATIAPSIAASLASGGTPPAAPPSPTMPPPASPAALQPPRQAGPSTTTATCNPVEEGLQRATREMNDALGGRGFKGPPAYWVQLSVSTRRETRNIGKGWDDLRLIYQAAATIRCGQTPPG